jgi:hypothetical protein
MGETDLSGMNALFRERFAIRGKAFDPRARPSAGAAGACLGVRPPPADFTTMHGHGNITEDNKKAIDPGWLFAVRYVLLLILLQDRVRPVLLAESQQAAPRSR